MPDNRESWRLGQLRPAEALPFLAALAREPGAVREADLRLLVTPDGAMRIVLPHWNAAPFAPKERVLEARAAVAAALRAATGAERDLGRIDSFSQDLGATFDFDGAALAAILLAASPSHPGERREGGRLALLRGPMAAVAERAAAVARRSRHAALLVAQGRSEQETVTVVRLEDDPEAGSTIEGLRASRAPFDLLAPQPTAAGPIWLPADLALDPEARGHAGIILDSLDAHKEGGSIFVAPAQKGEGLAILTCILPREAPFRPVAEALPPPPVAPAVAEAAGPEPLRLIALRPQPSEAAARALAARVADRRFPLGYRIALRPLSERHGTEADVEALRAEIEEREAEIALIRALAAPQLRLLRFSDRQLPALVDGMRRMPPAMLASAGLLFATAHTAGRTGPSHYVLYDPARMAMEGRLPEYHWRRDSGDDRPISFGLDPHASAAMSGRPGEPLVFVPARHRILPAISSFGGHLDETLRLVLGNLFADASAVMDRPGAQPMVVFAPSPEPGFEIEVELVDRAAFTPLHLNLRWINDHMLVRSPRLVGEGRVEELAEELYDGEVARDLAARTTADLAALDEAWAAGSRGLSARIAEALGLLTREVEDSALRVRQGLAFLARARTRIEAVDRSVEAMRDALSAADGVARDLDALVATQTAARTRFVTDLLAEIEAGELTVASSRERIAQHRAAIARLAEEFDW